MRRLFLFNPENDIALGLGLKRITPPRQAMLLHDAGAMLPFWLGDVDDYVLVDDGGLDNARKWVDGLPVAGPVPVSSGCLPDISQLCPWGWSLDACSQFEKAGVGDELMRGYIARMERYRRLSHRVTSLRMLRLLRDMGVDIPDVMPVEAVSVTQVEEYVKEHGAAFLKSPWSSSGRGVFPVSAGSYEMSMSRVEGIINRQGSVMVEPFLTKIQDFAMLFEYDGGATVTDTPTAGFAGYSLFFNSTMTNYGGNLVASDDEILGRLSMFVRREDIERLRVLVGECLEILLGDGYSGQLGVDMMIYGSDGERPRIAPCIELNLRTTMGFVARGVYKKLGGTGLMSVSPKRGGAVVDGAFRLTPENQWFDFSFRKE